MEVWSTSLTGSCTLGNDPQCQWLEDWVGHRCGLDAVGKDLNLCLCREFKHDLPVAVTVALLPP